jgi:hypothetical protein
VTILSNAAEEELDTTVALDLFFVRITFRYQIFSIAVQDVNLRGRNVDYET